MTEYLVEQDFLEIRSKNLKIRTLIDLIKSQRDHRRAKSVVTGIFKTFEEADHHLAEIPLRSYKVPLGYVIHLVVMTIIERDTSGNITSDEDLMIVYRDPESGLDRCDLNVEWYDEVIDEYELDIQNIIHRY